MAEAQHIYQAIGELLATLVVADNDTKFLQTGSNQYPVFIPHQVEKKYQEKYQGQQVSWRVYPKAVEHGLAFDVVTLAEEPIFGPGQFKLQGDWIESNRLQIWRNAGAGKVNAYNWQPRRLPINWQNAPAPDASFWQLKAQLVDATLKIVEAAGPFPHPPRLEKLPDFRQLYQKEQRVGTDKKPPVTKPAAAKPKKINWEDITPVSGKLEISIKINSLPQVQQVNGRCHFKIDCDGQVFQVSVKPKMWAKLETASVNYDQWVAAIAGKLGAATTDGFVLEEPNIQVFERQQSKQMERPKESLAAPQVQVAATELSHLTSEPSAASEAKISQANPQAVETATAESGQNSVAFPTPLARPSTAKAESKPKKVGKFNVEIR